MSRVRANKLVNRAGTGAPQLIYEAQGSLRSSSSTTTKRFYL